MASSIVVQEGNFVQQMEMVDKNILEIKEKLNHLHSKEVCLLSSQNSTCIVPKFIYFFF